MSEAVYESMNESVHDSMSESVSGSMGTPVNITDVMNSLERLQREEAAGLDRVRAKSGDRDNNRDQDKELLKPTEKKVYDFMCAYYRKHHVVPSARQISANFGFKSSRSAQNYINSLKEKSVITYKKPDTSAYMLSSFAKAEEGSLSRIPLVGSIAAGLPTESYELSHQFVNVPAHLFSKREGEQFFALKVLGNSMNGDSICDGDIAIIKKQDGHFHKDDILALRIDHDEFTLKRITLDHDSIQLLPSNPQFSIVEVFKSQVNILGKYVGLIRSCEYSV